MPVSRRITIGDVVYRRATERSWLRAAGLPWSRRLLLLNVSPLWASCLDALTTTRATWNGGNASGWKADILRVNGFDERMAYGGEDRELGERLVNLGIRPRQVRHRAVCVHLDHSRGYVQEEGIAWNQALRRETRLRRLVWTEHGIVKPLSADKARKAA